jgi:ferredoxin
VKVRVDLDLCVGHGRCYELAPQLFGEDERGHCRLLRETVPADLEAEARAAEANCPERAIHLEGRVPRA